MKTVTFTVFPAGVDFDTSDLTGGCGDRNDAFFNAHRYAAEHAAEVKAPQFVITSDGNRRIGFGGPTAAYLLKIMGEGNASYFDFTTTSWIPLEEEKYAVEESTGARA